MVNNLEIEIKKSKKKDEGFIPFYEDNGKKITYLIYSLELKRRLRGLVFPFGVSGSENDQYRGKSNQGDRVLYQQDGGENPDKLVLIKGKDFESKSFKQITNGVENQQEVEIRKEMDE